MFSSRDSFQIADIAGLQSTLNNYFTKAQVSSTTALVNYYTKDITDGYIEPR